MSSQIWGKGFYDFVPNYNHEEIEKRLSTYDYHLATLLTVSNIAKSLRTPEGREGAFNFFSESFEDQRRKLAEVIYATKDFDKRILDAFLDLERHLYVPKQKRVFSYVNDPIVLGRGVTLSSPWLAVYMTNEIDPSSGDSILEVGFGTGYHAFLVSETANSGVCLYGIEIDDRMYRLGLSNVKKFNYNNIKVVHGDGKRGWPNYVQFDKIYITAACKEVPKKLIGQLKDGGTIVYPRILTPLEVEVAISKFYENWKNYFGGITYKDYLKKWDDNVVLVTGMKVGNSVTEVSKLYDVGFVPMRSPCGKLRRFPSPRISIEKFLKQCEIISK